MVWVTPRTWIPNELVTANQLNEQLRDNTQYLHDELVYNVAAALDTTAGRLATLENAPSASEFPRVISTLYTIQPNAQIVAKEAKVGSNGILAVKGLLYLL